MAEITNLSDVSVTIDGESYSMIVIPDKKSKLVLAERNRVLRNINLTKLIIGLSRTSDLLYLAYNGVAGFGELTGAMTKLHDRFGKLCGKCDVELGNIERQSAQIQQKLKLVFTFLLKGEEQTAINFLEQCGVVAKELADKSYALSDEFDVLGNDTVDVLSKTQIVQGQQQEKKLALDKETSDIQAKTAKAKKVAEGLAEQKSKLDNLYQEAKWKSEIAENRAFALTLAGAVLKPVGEGIGAFTAMYSGGAAIGMAKSMLMPPQMPPPPSKAGVEKDVEVKTEALNTVESENGENEKLAAEEKAKQATAENVAAEKDALAEEAKKKAEAEKDADKKAKLVVEAELAATAAKHAHEKAEKAKAAAKKAADAAKATAERLKIAQAALEKAKETLTKAGEALEKMESSYTQVATQYGREKTEYLKMLMEKQDLEREALSSIAEYAERMKGLRGETQTVELTCSSLFQAIGALKQVSVVLRLASQFWANMAAACKDLARDDLRQVIKGFAALNKEERLSYFTGDMDFKTQVVRYYAGWKAIEIVSNEYAAEANAIMGKVHRDFKQNLKIEDARNLAIELGEKLLEDTAEDLAANERERMEIVDALKNQQAA